MKKTILFGLLALTAGVMNAEIRTLDEAQAIARQYLSEKAGKSVEVAMMHRAPRLDVQEEASAPTYYAFNDLENQTFVVVSGSTLTRPVLAYGAGAIDVESEELPDGLRWWLGAIERQTTYLEQHPETAETEEQLSLTVNPVMSLLDGIKWSQDTPFSDQCPTISGTHCPTGRVATAMAQIIRYYGYPTQGEGYHNYTSTYYEGNNRKSKNLYVDFSEQTYDYSLMPKRITVNTTEAEKAEIAKLSYHCGVAVNMAYEAMQSGTSSFSIDRALIENFSYNSKIVCISRDVYSYDEWIDIMHGELEAGRPILYTGISNYDNMGHAFVLDGVDQQGLFSVNWGWEGYCDGYFDIAILNPQGYGTGASMMEDGFCEKQDAIINITPEEGAGTFRSKVAAYSSSTLSCNKSSVAKGVTANYQLNSAYNYSGRTAKGTCGVLLMQDGQVLDKVYAGNLNIGTVNSYGQISGSMLSADYAVPLDLADGVYQLYFYYQPNNTDDYDIVRMVRSNQQSYMQLTVEGDNVTITRPSISIDVTSGNWSFESEPVGTRHEKISVELTNNGEEAIVGVFSLQLTNPNGSRTGWIASDNGCQTILPGATVTAEFDYNFKQAGEWKTRLMVTRWNIGTRTEQKSLSGSQVAFNVEEDFLAGAVFTLNEAPNVTSLTEDGKTYRNSRMKANLNVTNTGVDYKGRFAIHIFTKSTNPSNLTPVGTYESYVECNADKAAHDISFEFQMDLNISKNVTYYARPYYYNGTDWELLHSNLYATLKIYGQDEPSGIEQITVDEPVLDLHTAEVYNVLGKRIDVPSSGILPKGVYIVNGRKMVIK